MFVKRALDFHAPRRPLADGAVVRSQAAARCFVIPGIVTRTANHQARLELKAQWRAKVVQRCDLVEKQNERGVNNW